MSFTNYLEESVMNHVFGASTYTKPSLRVGLFTSAPGEAGGGTEVSGNGYARATATFTVTAGDPTSAENSANIDFPPATGSWGTITHVAIFDAASGGNMLAFAALGTSRAVTTDEVLRFTPGSLEFTLE
jgi:hypothetical protein